MEPTARVTFTRNTTEFVLSHLRALHAAGSGWANLSPTPRDEDDAEGGRRFSIFSGMAPRRIPLCTWSIDIRGRIGPAPTIGVQHGGGGRVARKLAEVGIVAPPAWRLVQDHTRRGIVYELPPEATEESALEWLLDAGEALALVDLTSEWVAEVFSP
jgi:hypothetical protein